MPAPEVFRVKNISTKSSDQVQRDYELCQIGLELLKLIVLTPRDFVVLIIRRDGESVVGLDYYQVLRFFDTPMRLWFRY